MHAVSHSLTHRGPTASRARSRWQPYASIATSSSRTPSSAYLNTPASSVSSSTPPSILLNPLCDLERIRFHAPPHSSTQSTIAASLREAQKARYVGRLIDQAVQSLCDIWHPDDIPPAFSGAPSLATDSREPSHPRHPSTTLFCTRNFQLPSPPLTPNHEPSPTLPVPDARESHCHSGEAACGNVLSIKGFVHEVLRRSRTSTGVLQTALCYLEAVRMKVPGLLCLEKARASGEDIDDYTSMPQIIQACPSAYAEDPACAYPGAVSEKTYDEPDTIRITDTGFDTAFIAQSALDGDRNGASVQNAPPLPPLPRQPSPLCCPRRTFLACLILASKFMQDRSYSNRAWAKLAGLPPREIGRCERAVGEALGWRLWVGKGIGPPVGSSGSAGRMVSRTRSDGDLLKDSAPAATAADWMSPTAASLAPLPTPSLSPYVQYAAATTVPAQTMTNGHAGLRRCATVPDVRMERADVFRSHDACAQVFNAPYATLDEPAPYMHPDGYYYAPAPDMATAVGPAPQQDFSPPLSTPTLSYSPMSSASSSSDGPGDRTIQMTFTDSPAPYAPPLAHSASGLAWAASGCAVHGLKDDPKGYELYRMPMAEPHSGSGFPGLAADPGVPDLALYGLSYHPARELADEC